MVLQVYTDDSNALNTYKRRSNKLIKLLLIASVLYFVYMAFAKFPDLLLKLNLNALLDLIILMLHHLDSIYGLY